MSSSYSYFPPNKPSKLFNANNLAIFTSIGIHLVLLGIVLPSLAAFSDNKKTTNLRDIRVIELNPVEQSRLPNTSPTTTEIPQLPNTPLGENSLPDLSSLDTTTLPPLESVSPTPNLPSLPPLSSVDIYPPPVASLPSTVNTPQSYSSLPIPKLNPPPLPENNLPDNNTRVPQTQRPNFDPFKETLTLDDIRRASMNTSEQAQQTPNTTQNPSQVATNPNIPSTSDRQGRRPLSDVLQGVEAVEYSSKNTTQQEALENDVAWMQRIGQTVDKTEKFISINGTYPKGACARQITGKSIYGVMVNAQGVVSNSPTLLQSAGYPILDRQAMNEVVAYRFPTGQAKPYRVTVSFTPNPNICRSTTIAPTNPVETRVNPPTTPNVEVNPKPSPTVQPSVNPSPNSKPNNSTVQPSTSPKPGNLNEETLPAAKPKPEDLIEQPTNPSANPKPNNLVEPNEPSINQPAPSPSLDQTQTNTNVEPPSPPTTKKPEVSINEEPSAPQKPNTVEPPSPPTSKKDSPLKE